MEEKYGVLVSTTKVPSAETLRRKAYHRKHYLKNRENKLKQCLEYKRKNRDKVRFWNAQYRKTFHGEIRSYRNHAKAKGIPFELSDDDFKTFYFRDCHYCGGKIERVGIDRVDNEIGYTKDNTVPCCELCNRMKSVMDVDVFLKQCEKVSRHTNLNNNAVC
jgi:hypothetical protein